MYMAPPSCVWVQGMPVVPTRCPIELRLLTLSKGCPTCFRVRRMATVATGHRNSCWGVVLVKRHKRGLHLTLGYEGACRSRLTCRRIPSRDYE